MKQPGNAAPGKTRKGRIKQSADLTQMGPIGELFTGHLQRVDYLLSRATAQAWEGRDLRTGTIAALSSIVANPGMSQSDIVNATSFDKSAVNAIVNTLEQLGWANRTSVDSDRRRYALHPTEAGEKMLKDIVERVEAIEAQLLAGLTAKEKAQLRALLDRLHGSCVAAGMLEI